MCLKCNEQPHFPAKCSQFVSYKNDLVKHGDAVIVEDNDTHYVSVGKYCPNKQCRTYMEKNSGCNHMHCSVCKKEFCWNCHKLWEDHLRLNQGNYSCQVQSDNNKNQVEIEFKTKHRKKRVDKESRYQESLNHRQLRVTDSYKKEKKELVKRMMRTLDFKDDLEEAYKFLNEAICFLAELHFICEFSYVSMRDSEQATRMSISHVVRCIELVIYQMNQILKTGKGLEAIDRLRVAFNRGLNCIKILNKIK